MNAESKHKIKTANSAPESLLKYYYTRPPERRVTFESTCCVGFLSLKSKIQAANGHEIGLGISSHYHHACALHLHLFISGEYEFLQNSLPPKKELHTATSS